MLQRRTGSHAVFCSFSLPFGNYKGSIPLNCSPAVQFLYAKGESDFSHAPRAHKLKLTLTLFFAVSLCRSVTTQGTSR